MAHANARLTQFGRLLLVQPITELGWPPAQAAEAVGVSRATAYKWLVRYRQHGMAGLADRSSRPYRCPHALTAAQVRRVLAARRRRRQGPHRLGYHLGMPRSTIYGILRRHGMSRLAHTDRTAARSSATSASGPGSWSTWTSRSWAASPTAAATVPTAGQRPVAAGGSATTTFTRPSTTAPGSPSASSCPTRAARPPPDSWSRRPASSLSTGCGSSEC
jgi:transposase